MILVDANLLLYAKIASFSVHSKAKKWLDGVLSSGERCAIPWESTIAFVRIATNPRIFQFPLETKQAWEQAQEWLSRPGVWIPTASDQHQELLEGLIPYCSGNPGLIHDAHLAALARGHGLVVYSSDTDFARFPLVDWRNPLEI